MRVLFLTHRLPYAPDRGDRVRAYHLLRELHRFAQVDVVSLVHSAAEEARAGDLRDLSATVQVARVPSLTPKLRALMALPGSTPLTHVLLDSPGLLRAIESSVATHKPDVVLTFCSGIAPYALTTPLDRLPLVVDMVDVDSTKWAELAAKTRGPLRWIYRREAHRLAQFEAEVTARARVTLVVTDREKQELRRLSPVGRIETVSNGIDLDYFRPPATPAPDHTVVFCGVLNYAPNEDAALWLAREIWPIVRQSVPSASLLLVGAHPTNRVRALADQSTGVHVTGYVSDVRPYLHQASVSVAPLRTARGVQNKVLEALATSLPCVVTPAVAAGLPAEVLKGCDIWESAREIALAVVRLLKMAPASRRAFAHQADIAGLGWEQRLAPLRGLLEQASR